MPIEIITPKTEQAWLELRVKDLTSSEIGALFGISPYVTLFELWHRKKNGKIVENEINEWIKWGKRLQDSIAAGIAEDNNWNIRRMDEYIRIPELRLGSSFDFSICHHPTDGLGSALVGSESEDSILEIKNVFAPKFKDEWLEDEGGNIEAPPSIEIQVQHQLLVSGRKLAYIGALVGGNKVVLIKRTPDYRVHKAIEKEAKAFWDSVDRGTPPTPNFQLDSEFICKLYGYAEPGKIADLRGRNDILTLALEHRELGQQMKEADERRDAIKSELYTVIGDAEKTLGDGFSISAGLVGPAHIEYDRTGYRTFRINWPKGKK